MSNPAVMMGKPVVEGTRITVELILEKLAAGETVEQILAAHPRLAREASRLRWDSLPMLRDAPCGAPQHERFFLLPHNMFPSP